MKSIEENNNPLKFFTDKHLKYIRKVSSDTTSFEYVATQHLRMSGVYWGLTAMALLGIDLKSEPSYVGMIDWVMKCQDPVTGGYSIFHYIMFIYS